MGAPVETAPKPPASLPTASQSKEMSLASLLSAGKAPDPKSEEKPQAYQSLWDRNGAQVVTGLLTEDQVEALNTLHSKEEEREEELRMLRSKVVAEFAQAGVFEEEVIEQAYQEQLKEYDLKKLLRPQDIAAKARARSSRSSSRSSGRTSSSRSRSRSRSRPQEEAGA